MSFPGSQHTSELLYSRTVSYMLLTISFSLEISLAKVRPPRWVFKVSPPFTFSVTWGRFPWLCLPHLPWKLKVAEQPSSPRRTLPALPRSFPRTSSLSRSFPWSLALSPLLLGFVFLSCGFSRPCWRFFSVACNPSLAVWFGSKVLTARWRRGSSRSGG